MSLFTNYDNLRDTYFPNNRTADLQRRRIRVSDEFPHKEYNLCGDFIGYSWNYGDTPTLTFHLNPRVYVEDDAIIYTEDNYAPTTSTVGKLGQRAYNTYDLKEWVCTTLDQDVYTWELQKEFTIPNQKFECGKEIVLQIFKEFVGYNITVTIFNFRMESIKSFTLNSISDDVGIYIDKDTSAELLKGIYYCSLTVERDNDIRVFYQYPLIIK